MLADFDQGIVSIAARTCVVTEAMESDGRMRKLTIASAAQGSTFALTPPLILVTAVVVRIAASVARDSDSRDVTSGENSHQLVTARRSINGISGANRSNMSVTGGARLAGIGLVSNR